MRRRRRFILPLLLTLLAGWPGLALAEASAIDWRPVAQRVLPAVVNISVETLARDPNDGSLRRRRELGSGFLIDPSGLIVTNKHVVEGAFRITVTTREDPAANGPGTQWNAQLIGAGRMIDLAVLKISTGHDMPFLKFANSDAVQVGDPVLVIGNPLGLGTSVSGGLVSALNRNLMNTPLDDYIQTDAAINHGNSGGPVLDTDGDVVGVATILVTAKADEGSNGLGFAIAGWDSAAYIRHLLNPKRSTVGWIGVHLQDVTSDLVSAFQLRQSVGFLITQIDPGSPAEKAGLQSGDVILSEDNSIPSDARALLRKIVMMQLGSAETLKINRQGKEMTVSMAVAQWPNMEMPEGSVTNTLESAAEAGMPDLGLILTPISGAARRLYGITADRGVVVVAVDPTSEAFTQGIAPGDIIRKVQDQPVATADDVIDGVRLAQKQQRFVAVLVSGKAGERWIPLYAGHLRDTAPADPSELSSGVAAAVR